jgi:hypothetical protein
VDLNPELFMQITSAANATRFTQGVVTGVDVASGVPQIIVNGTAYDLSRVLTVQPAAANP